MKIYVNRIPPEGYVLNETVDSVLLDLDAASIQFRGPLKIEARVFKVTNAVTVTLGLTGMTVASCNRCLKEFESPFTKSIKLDYAAERPDQVLDLSQDIREEIILDYPIQFLCAVDCLGLCPHCGKDLNEGECGCRS